jgi:purine-binding chemotaxis protein CheW
MAQESRDSLCGLFDDMTSGRIDVLVFSLDEPQYALPLSAVERVVRAVGITPLPKAPSIVLGVINAKGTIIPVLDVRSRFRLPFKEITCDDRFILARTPIRVVALAVNGVSGIREVAMDAIAVAKVTLPFAGYIHGVAALDDGLVIINDLDSFLSLGEEDALAMALSGSEK